MKIHNIQKQQDVCFTHFIAPKLNKIQQQNHPPLCDPSWDHPIHLVPSRKVVRSSLTPYDTTTQLTQEQVSHYVHLSLLLVPNLLQTWTSCHFVLVRFAGLRAYVHNSGVLS